MLRGLIHLLVWGLVGANLLALLAPWIAPDFWWPPLFAAYGFLYILLGQLLLMLLPRIYLSRINRAILFLSLLISLPFLGAHFQLRGTVSAPTGALLATTLNTHSLKKLWKNDQHRQGLDPDKVALFFPEGRQPDILCLQEVPLVYKVKGSDWGMKGAHIHRFRNIVLLSRFPLKNPGQKEFQGSGNTILWADVRTPGGDLRVYNAHLQSHSITEETEALIQAPIDDGATWKGLRRVLGRVRHYTAMRAEQARWLEEQLDSCSLPILLAGDLNDTPQSYSYHRVSRNLSDSFREKGRGFGTTFAGMPRGLRIDVLLGGKGLVFLDHQVYRTALSDHYPVSAFFQLTE